MLYQVSRTGLPLPRFGTGIAALWVVALLAFAATTRVTAQETEAEDPVAAFNQAQDLHEKGDLTGAIKLYEKALKIEPAFPEAEFQRGMAELALGKPADAERSFRRALALRADWTMPMTSLGSLLINRGEFDEAGKLLSKAVDLEPQNAVALSALTELRLNTKAQPPVLEDLLRKVSDLSAKANASAALWSARAALELALQRRTAARSSVGRALSTDPNHKPSIYQLIDIAVSDGDIEKANAGLARLGTEQNDQIRVLRASVLAADGKTEEALRVLETLTRPSDAGDELKKRITLTRATGRTELEKALESEPNNITALSRLCALLRRDEPEKALVYCQKASAADPTNPNHAVGFAAALVQAKQYETAVAVLRKILEVVPDNFTARANLAGALFQLKRHAEARTEFEWLVNAQPRSAGPYLFLGIIYDEAGEYMDAAANYQQYLRLADPVAYKLDIEKVNLRLPLVMKLIKDGKGKKPGK